MSEAATQNRFAPPRAIVEDHALVETEMVDAKRGSRFLATLVDWLPSFVVGIVAAIAIPAYMFSHRGTGDGAERGVGIAGLVLGAAFLAYGLYNLVLMYRYGQTFGKRALGLRVVRTDGARLGLARYVFLRGMAIGLLLGGVAAAINAIFGVRLALHPFVNYGLWAVDAVFIFRASRQCLHDSIADTKVVTAASSENATLAGLHGAHLRTISF